MEWMHGRQEFGVRGSPFIEVFLRAEIVQIQVTSDGSKCYPANRRFEQMRGGALLPGSERPRLRP